MIKYGKSSSSGNLKFVNENTSMLLMCDFNGRFLMTGTRFHSRNEHIPIPKLDFDIAIQRNCVVNSHAKKIMQLSHSMAEEWVMQ